MIVKVVHAVSVDDETFEACHVAEDDWVKEHAFVRRRGGANRWYFDTVKQAIADVNRRTRKIGAEQ